MPSKAASHGAPARRYLNERVTGVLLEGMKRLAADQYVWPDTGEHWMKMVGRERGADCYDAHRPDNPLQVLGEFLIQRGKDLEGVKQESTT